MNETYRTFFPVDPPARATVRVDLGNPDFLIEIQAIAYIG
jgi:enamine deaminase RidA (YjgF/YER057c/UK114 family)